MITATLTSQRHIAAATAAWLASSGGYPSAEAFAQATMEFIADGWADSTGVDRIPVSAFVRRFPGPVMDAVNASADPNVIAILAQLDAVQTVRLGHPTTTGGVGYLVSAGYLTQAQADVVLHYEVPVVP